MRLNGFAICLSLVLLVIPISNSISEGLGNDAVSSEIILEEEPILDPMNGGLIENLGQWDDDILFRGETDFGDVAIMRDSILFNLEYIESEDGFDPLTSEKIMDVKGTIIQITFEGSNILEPIGIQPRTQKNNYYLGPEENWAEGVNIYDSVLIPNIYDDIDMKISNNEGLKYEFILNPGSDYREIKMNYVGQRSIDLVDNEIILTGFHGTSIIDGGFKVFYNDNKDPIESSINLVGNQITYSLEEYDGTRQVVIDPLVYSTYYGGSRDDYFLDVISSSTNEKVFTGFTYSTDFPTTIGAYKEELEGFRDIVVMKLNTNMKSVVFSTYIGGESSDIGHQLCDTGSDGYIVIGISKSSDYPTTSNAFNSSLNGEEDVVITIFDKNGGNLRFSSYFGGGDDDIVLHAEMYGTNVYLGGYSRSLGLANISSYQNQINNGYDGFISIFNISNLSVDYTTYIGGNSNEFLNDIVVNEYGVFILGTTYSNDYPETPDAFRKSPEISEKEIFLSQLSLDLKSLVYSTYIGGSDHDEGISMVESDDNEIIIGCTTLSPDMVTYDNSYDSTYNGSGNARDIYMIKFNHISRKFSNGTYLGGVGFDEIDKIMVHNESVIILGNTSSSDFPVITGSFDDTFNQGGFYQSDIFLTKMDINLSRIKYSTFFGGTEDDFVFDGYILNDNIHFCGYTDSSDFPITNDALYSSHRGDYDGFYSVFSFPTNPGSPTELTGEIENGQVSLSWTLPEDDGGARITSYRLYKGTSEGDLSEVIDLDDSTQFTDTNIDNGQIYYYTISAFNIAGESERSNIVKIEDTEEPVFINRYEPVEVFTGEETQLKVSFTDNVKVSDVTLYYVLDSDELQSSMQIETNDWWITNISIPFDQFNNVSYWYEATDTSGLINTTEIWEMEVSDNIIPSFTDAEAPAIIHPGQMVSFNVSVTDNIDVKDVTLFYRFQAGPWSEKYLINEVDNRWTVDLWIDNFTGYIEYYHSALDTSDNKNITEMNIINITDVTSPVLVAELPETIFNGVDFDIMINVTDNIGIEFSSLEYWFDDEDLDEITIDDMGEIIRTIDVPVDVEYFSYRLYASDWSGNEERLSYENISITDNIPPEIEEIIDASYSKGDTLNITVEASDNRDELTVEWTSDHWSGDSDRILIELDRVGNFTFNVSVTDASGNTVFEEFIIEVLDNNPDTDGDGIPNDVELLHSLDPEDPADGDLDKDDDGLSNVEEYELKTNISDPDTDGDGMPDGWEYDNSLDPLTSSGGNDADSDGISDLEEYKNGTDPNISNKEDEDGPSENGTILPLILIVIGVILLLLIISTILFIRSRSKKDDTQKNVEPSPIVEAGPQVPESMPKNEEVPVSSGSGMDLPNDQYPDYDDPEGQPLVQSNYQSNDEA